MEDPAMTEQFNERNDPRKAVMIRDRVVVRDDSKLAGITMLGVLVAIVLAGGALVYAISGPHDTTTISVIAPTPERSNSTVGQGQSAPAPKTP
jgi:hypothetical protein